MGNIDGNIFIYDDETKKSFEKMSKDVVEAAGKLTTAEARYLVDFYYTVQKNRIRLENQIRSIEKPWSDWNKEKKRLNEKIEKNNTYVEILSVPVENLNSEDVKKILNMGSDKKADRFTELFNDKVALKDAVEKKKASLIESINEDTEKLEKWLLEEPSVEPHATLNYFLKHYSHMENNIKKCLSEYSMSTPIGRWMNSIIGIGPVISAGLMANIDITKVKTAGQIERFGGIDPTVKWESGKKRPWNASLKTLFWKIGQSFIKTSSKPNDVYGKIYLERKIYEERKNEAGEYAEFAKLQLTGKNWKCLETKAIYESGKLPKSHIISRCARYATKIFVSHLFSVWYEMEHGEKPPKPYAMAILNHAHMIEIPNWE